MNVCIFAVRHIRNYWLPLRAVRRFFSESYYDVLRVSPTCSAKEIREAFLLLSKQTHPDKHLNDPSMHEKFVRLNEAYSTLSNPSSRRAYDLTLYNERKLNPPYDKPYGHTYSRRKTSTYYDTTFHSTKSSKSSNSGYYKDPFSWEYKSKTESNYGNQFSSGLRGVKKFSNTVIVGLLLSITVFGAIIQILAIRRSFLLNQEHMLERSHQYSLIHKLAKERAKLHGNAYQIELLKKNLAGSYDESADNDTLGRNMDQVAPIEHVSNEEAMKNVKVCKDQILKNNEDPNDIPNVGKAGVCAVHGNGTHGQCAVHHKQLNNDLNKSPEPTNSPSDDWQKCKKCGHKMH